MGFNSGFKGLNTAHHVSGTLMPIIRSLSTAVAASGLSLERGGSSAVGRGRAGRLAQLDATISQVYYLTFTRMYSSTCFGRPHAHHPELNNCSSSLWFYRWSVVVAVVLVVVNYDQQHCYHHASAVKSEAATAVVVAPDDGLEDPETC